MSEKKYKSLRRVVREIFTRMAVKSKGEKFVISRGKYLNYKQFLKKCKEDFRLGRLKLVRGQ